jgi:hypothetical protein
MPQKFVIDADQGRIEEAVRQIEQDFAFQAVQAIKSLQLAPAEERVVLEISRQGRCSLATLHGVLGGDPDELAKLVAEMVAKTYLVEVPVITPPSYVLSFALQPPRPISPEIAHQINQQINREGGVNRTYVEHIYRQLGEPGLQIIANVLSEQGSRYATALAEVRSAEAGVVGRRFVELMRANGAPLNVLKTSPEQVIFRQTECPYRLQAGQTRLCDAVNSFDRALLGELGCNIRYTARLVDGASYCEAVIERAVPQNE